MVFRRRIYFISYRLRVIRDFLTSKVDRKRFRRLGSAGDKIWCRQSIRRHQFPFIAPLRFPLFLTTYGIFANLYHSKKGSQAILAARWRPDDIRHHHMITYPWFYNAIVVSKTIGVKVIITGWLFCNGGHSILELGGASDKIWHHHR
jgi:hypothetical protein